MNATFSNVDIVLSGNEQIVMQEGRMEFYAQRGTKLSNKFVELILKCSF